MTILAFEAIESPEKTSYSSAKQDRREQSSAHATCRAEGRADGCAEKHFFLSNTLDMAHFNSKSKAQEQRGGAHMIVCKRGGADAGTSSVSV
jgi:hypothetical protein